ncbi:MAG: YidC/Oxa1 family insertase periplasmic-domain containing protein [Bdellovibrionales bacterium]|nr:YidC/Oxa1 family insertase periplasmic-domain containing protein [Bdellovibrionales bacterium]
MSNEQGQNFLDSKTIIAVILVGVSWVGWQSYLQTKYPEHYKEKQKTTIEQTTEGIEDNSVEKANNSQVINEEKPSTSVKTDELAQEEIKNYKSFHFADEVWSFDISPIGMGLENIKLKDYSTRDGQDMAIGTTKEGAPFATNIIGKNTPLYFDIKKLSSHEYLGKARFGNAQIEKRIEINSKNHIIDTKLFVSEIKEEDTFSGLTTYLGEKLVNQDSGIPFLPQFERQEVFVIHEGDKDRMLFAKESVNQSFQKVKLAAISTQYFAQALLDKSDVMPEIKANIDANNMVAQATISHSIINRSKDFYINYLAFAGPKSLKLLSSIDENMSEIVDLGWFSGLAKLILKIMKFFYSIFGNWGVAIILLTILVRFIVLPFNLMSVKSMKKMQAVQPQIQALREKFKDDPQKLNQEMMHLFKSNKVNPMGGCLPMLLQFPVFIALYQMLGQSIELYQAPFGFWIHDLSVKDPYYILPVLMGITMFVQQKVTPSTMDPTQQKIFMFMPVIFSLFMITLPSGLTLYIFVSALFAVIQQVLVMRDSKTQTA